MLVDEAEIIVIGGHGGSGKVSFYPPPQKGPDGGNGGRGGDVYIKVTSDLTALRRFTTIRILTAENGAAGWKQRSSGKDGDELEILMPQGTVLTNQNTDEEIELNNVNERILIAKGGLGGKGNFEFKSSTRTTPEFAQPGLPGEKKHFQVSLKLIADFGLIGLPNAGKSSVLNELTAASAKVANYPFTTLEPNLGVIALANKEMDSGSDVRNDNNHKIIADIPGLIEGASSGKGLGIKFLKHIEKVKVLLHCISAESEDPLHDYQVIKNELDSFSPEMSEKQEIILLTKTDLVDAKDIKKKQTLLKKLKKEIIPVSIHDWDSLESLKVVLTSLRGGTTKQSQSASEALDSGSDVRNDPSKTRVFLLKTIKNH